MRIRQHRVGCCFRLGEIAGIDVYAHDSWFLVIGFYTYIILATMSLELYFGILWLTVAGIYMVLIHEFGHVAAALRLRLEVDMVVLHPLGGHVLVRGRPHDPRGELWLSLSGPAANLASAVIFAPIALAARGGFPFVPDSLAGLPGSFALVNLAVAGINLAPVFPLDGARGLIAHLTARRGRRHAWRATGAIGIGICVLALVGLHLWTAGAGKWVGSGFAAFLILLSLGLAFGGPPPEKVGDLVRRHLPTIEETRPLCAAHFEMRSSMWAPRDFVVERNRVPIGVLRGEIVAREVASGNLWAPVGDFADPLNVAIPDDVTVIEARKPAKAARSPAAAAVGEGGFQGIVWVDEILQAAEEHAPERGERPNRDLRRP